MPWSRARWMLSEMRSVPSPCGGCSANRCTVTWSVTKRSYCWIDWPLRPRISESTPPSAVVYSDRGRFSSCMHRRRHRRRYTTRNGPSDQTKSTDLSEARAVDLAKTRQSPQTCRRPVRTQRTLSETRVGERRYRCAKPPDCRRPGSPTESGRARGLVEFGLYTASGRVGSGRAVNWRGLAQQ